MYSRNKRKCFTFVALLKACADKQDLQRGSKLHADILKRGLLERSSHLTSGLITMYAKCGALSNAQDVLETLPVRDAISWNALIAGYVHQGQDNEALRCLDAMQSEGLSPDVITLTCILKACGRTGNLDKGEQVHDEIVHRALLEKDIVLGTALADMYAKCGALSKALKVLEELPVRDEICWNTIISGYIRHGKGHKALKCFEQMRGEGLLADPATFLFTLKACGMVKEIDKGVEIHDEIAREGLLKKDIFLGTALVDMYIKCGELSKAQLTLKENPVQDTGLWNALIAGYVENGQSYEAWNLFERMQSENISADSVTFTCILKACCSMGIKKKGKKIHQQLIDTGLLRKDAALCNGLIEMYAKCGIFQEARKALSFISVPNVIYWYTLILGYVQLGQDHEALNCFEEMRNAGIYPDAILFFCILKICGNTKSITKGKRIHDEIRNRGLLENDIVLGSSLVDMYVKCGLLAKAQEVLEELPMRDTVCWNALISGYVLQGQGWEALNSFRQMQSEGLAPDSTTYISLVKVCGIAGARDMGKQIHDEIVRKLFLQNNPMLGSVLVNMYAELGMLLKARQTFDDLYHHHVITWNVLIAGYMRHGQCHEALNCFEGMQIEGTAPNTITFIHILKACGIMGAVHMGKDVHVEIANRCLMDKDITVANALVDMYVKCGAQNIALEVLEKLPFRNVVSWSALIAGCAQQGHINKALGCLEQMEYEGIFPDDVLFLCVLNACTHSGLLNEAETLFRNMTKKYNVDPTVEHHTCMIITYGCIGHFDRAISLIKVIPTCNDIAVWLALLTVCRKWGNVMIGILAFDQVVQLDVSCTGAYILMTQIFSDAGMQQDAKLIESMRLKYAICEERGNCTCANTNEYPALHS